MIQKPAIGIGVSCGLFSVCTLMEISNIMQALGAIAAGSTAILIFIYYVIDKWKGK